MAKQPTPAQRRAVAEADPDTGLVRGRESVLEALAGQGWVVRHPRPPHRCYLTPAGRQFRQELLAPAPQPPGPDEGTTVSAGVFSARSGDEAEPADGRVRAREVSVAWEGLLELRRLTNRTGSTEVPCPWERTHLVAAVGLALEAADCRPSAVDGNGLRCGSGYRLFPWSSDDAVRVTWAGAASAGAASAGPASSGGARSGSGDEPVRQELGRYARALERAGWQVSEHPDRKSGAPFLLASPRRAAPAPRR
ncbi:hypothetical protein ABZW18_10230 [Streptomyces sp. NPDC004647]|uniref:hypothetical protein n=1 Tax=Streptomyces sp. NPDC004647 TaxID=3154671 RepID=UPI00339F4394